MIVKVFWPTRLVHPEVLTKSLPGVLQEISIPDRFAQFFVCFHFFR